MVPVVLETRPPSPQAVTVKYVAINQDNCKIHKDGGKVGGITVSLFMLRLVHEKVFAWKGEGFHFAFFESIKILLFFFLFFF